MHRIDSATATPENLFQDNLNPGTRVTAAWLNDIQENMAAVIEEAGIALVKGDAGQLLAAINALMEAKLDEVDPIGVPKLIMSNVVPARHAKINGQALSRAAYPKLWAFVQASGLLAASVAEWNGKPGWFGPGNGTTTFNLPKHRGEFYRVWDDGAGIDAGRGNGTSQDSQNLAHTHPSTGGGYVTPDGNAFASTPDGIFDEGLAPSTGSSGGNEARPRNIAYMAVMRIE